MNSRDCKVYAVKSGVSEESDGVGEKPNRGSNIGGESLLKATSYTSTKRTEFWAI